MTARETAAAPDLRTDPPAPPGRGRLVRVFVSSPGDARFERLRVERVVERLNGQFAGLVRLQAIRWELDFYQAHKTFQAQIPEAADCDIVLAVLRHRLGTELPSDFRHMPNGEPYPSGTAYEILTAMESGAKRGLPDLYVFRYPEPPTVRLDDAETNKAVTDQWNRLKVFFARWFHTPEGHFKASYHEFRTTDEFEAQVEALLRKWVEDKILRGRAVVWPVETRGSPFRGLAAFGPEHMQVFFGRTRDIAKALDTWKDAAERGTPFLLLVGASGVGKSSLARAGVVPRLTTPGVVAAVDVWRTVVLTPTDAGADPIDALAERLFGTPDDHASRTKGPLALPELREGDYGDPKLLARLLRHADETAAKPIVAALDKAGAAERARGGYDRPVRAELVLLVDQLDEVFGAGTEPERRHAFARVLKALVATGRVWVVATLRADLYDRFLGEPEFLDLKTRGGTYDLAAPGPAELAEIVRGPALAADLTFEADARTGERLDERLLADADRPDMLPLLQFTLDQLFERREQRDGATTLTFAAYAALGGIAGAVDRQAEQAIAALSPEDRERLPRLLRVLARPTRGERGTSLTVRAVPLAEAAYDPPAARLVEALVDARILRASGGGGSTTVRLSHERVLTNWARARDIVAGNVGFFRIRDDVEDQRRRWEESGRKRDLLIPRGLPLAEAESVVKTYGPELPRETTAFIAASGNAARRRQRLVAAAAVVFALIAVVAVWQTLQANADRAAAIAAQEQAETNRVAAEDARNLAQANQIAADEARELAEENRLAAEEAREDAELNLVEADQARAEAEANLATATLERDRAQRNLGAAQDVIAAIVFDVVQGLRNIAGIPVATIRSLLERAQSALTILADAGSVDVELMAARAAVLSELFKTLVTEGNSFEALAMAEESLEATRAVAAAAPESALYRRNVGIALQHLAQARLNVGDIAGVEAPAIESIEILQGLFNEYPDELTYVVDFTSSLDVLGTFRLLSGDLEGAAEMFEQAVALTRLILEVAPGEPEFLRLLSVGLNKLGDGRRGISDFAGAEEAYVEGLAVARDLLELDPTNMLWIRDVATHLENISILRADQGDFAAAIATAEEAVDLLRDLVKLDAANIDNQVDLSITLGRLGDAYAIGQDYVRAAAVLDEALTIARRIATNPDDLERQRSIAILLSSIGSVRLFVGDRAGARTAFAEDLAISRRLAETEPENLRYRFDLIASLYSLASASEDAERAALSEEALALVQMLVEAEVITADQGAALEIAFANIATEYPNPAPPYVPPGGAAGAKPDEAAPPPAGPELAAPPADGVAPQLPAAGP